MSLNAATIAVLLEKGLTGEDILEVARAAEQKADRTNAERQARHRAKAKSRNAVTVTDNVSPNDIYSNPLHPSEAKASALPTAEKVVSAWNVMADANDLPTARALNPARRKHLTARIREHGEQAVFEAIEKLGKSDWHCGRKPGSDWKADLGWLLKSPESFQKMLERPGHGPPPEPTDTLSHLTAKYRKAA